MKALNKKENKGGAPGSPDGGDSDGDGDGGTASTTLTPRTEAKYNKIDEEFQIMMHRNSINGNRVCLGSPLDWKRFFFKGLSRRPSTRDSACQ